MPSHAITRRTLLSTAAATVALGWRTPTRAIATQDDATRRSLAAAAEFLWNQQGDNGGWQSPQYGLMRSGQSLTPFVLDALLDAPTSTYVRPADGVDRALGFLVDHIDEHGCLGSSDPEVIEYPVYSTAYALRCLLRPLEESDRYKQYAAARERRQKKWERKPSGNSKIPTELANYLVNAQFREKNGFNAADPAYGGWGYDAPLAPGRPGHMDLAHTRRAIQALAAVRKGSRGIRPIDDYGFVEERAQSFLRVVQKHPRAAARPQLTVDGPSSDAPPPLFDGGFYFSPVVLAANKGRIADEPTPHWRSYATATCDGILALLAAGVPRDDERVTAAAEWLKRHTNLEYPQGVPRDYPEPWGAAIRFYHYAVRAEVYRALEWPAEERAQLAAVVYARQEADGSFVNRDSPLMKEDDPVLCTTLATVALANCLS